MTFYNLSCRKPNGDFMVTSSEVLIDKGCPADIVVTELLNIAADYIADGYDVELTQNDIG